MMDTSTELITSELNDKYTIKFGEYIILQKGNFLKIHQLSKNGCVMLGRDKIDLTSIVGQKYWTTFKMIHKKGSKREFELAACDKSESLLNLMDKDIRGIDNRNIWDDGSSQTMSAEEIVKLRDKGCTGQDIVGHLLENSKTFHCKTEYSQHKYLKKKERKYFEYVIIHRPNIRIISQILYSKDPQKILNLRFDTLSQIVTAVNLQPFGNYILFENGCQGLVSALILNQLGGNGNLIHLFPNQHYQKHAVLAMNFSQKELNSFISVRLSTFVKKMFPTPVEIKQEAENVQVPISALKTSVTSVNENDVSTIKAEDMNGRISSDQLINSNDSFEVGESKETCISVQQVKDEKNENDAIKVEISETDNGKLSDVNEPSKENGVDTTNLSELKDNKRKLAEFENGSSQKKFKWEMEVDKAVDILMKRKADGLIIVCKDYPIHLINKLINLVMFSRNIVIFSMYQEPLVKLYCELKLRRDVIGLKLTESFLRNYQVLPDRTHPEINMSSSGGFLLTATVVSPQESACF